LSSEPTMSSAAHQPLVSKAMNGSMVPLYNDAEVNEWSELLTNEQEVAIKPDEAPPTTIFRHMTGHKEQQSWKLAQKHQKFNTAQPIMTPRDWLEMRQQSTESHSREMRLPAPPPPPTSVPLPVPPQPPPKKFQSGPGNAKSNPAPPIPRGKMTITNENFSNLSERSSKRNSQLTEKQVIFLTITEYQQTSINTYQFSIGAGQ